MFLLTNVCIEIFQISCLVQFHLYLGFPDPITTSLDDIPVFFPGHPFVPLWFVCLLPQFDHQVLAQLYWLPVSCALLLVMEDGEPGLFAAWYIAVPADIGE